MILNIEDTGKGDEVEGSSFSGCFYQKVYHCPVF